MDELNSTIQQPTEYNDDDIKTLDWMEHIRRRPGMYIGKLGDGSYADDGIYVLLKEVLESKVTFPSRSFFTSSVPMLFSAETLKQG